MADAFDAVVVGAGTSGAAAALHLARRGLRVALVDARDRDDAGAQWWNGVPPWMFDRAGIARPAPPEDRTVGDTTHIVDAHGRTHLTVTGVEMRTIDMRALGARLRGEAEAAGCTIVDRARVTGVQVERDRARAIEIAREGATRTIGAALFVDAGGMRGALRRRVPALAQACAMPRATHIATAAHAVRHVADLDGARAFLERHRARSGDAVTFLGVEGSWSTCMVRVDLDAREVDFVTGAIAFHGHRSGRRILLDFVAQAPWVGDDVVAGEGAIPLRRPYDLLAASGVALVGDAACMVFPAHGSGVGTGLIAARILADAVVSDVDPGSEAALARYRAAFHRELGGVLAAYDVLRRMLQATRPEALPTILEHLVTHASTDASLAQRMPAIDAAQVAKLARGGARVPRVALPFAAAAGRMQHARALYAAHPQGTSRRALGVWSRAVAAVLGDRPDVA